MLYGSKGIDYIDSFVRRQLPNGFIVRIEIMGKKTDLILVSSRKVTKCVKYKDRRVSENIGAFDPLSFGRALGQWAAYSMNTPRLSRKPSFAFNET